ncbi:hypothetical protein HMPREF7545_1140 [Selenomonas noxia ATCC 43541]|nr:hypothetical protein HMPREF7545_1140 [Selenomonas noxia ATCC 43541]
MTENLWSRRLNEDRTSCCKKSVDFLRQLFYFFAFPLAFFFST